MATQNPAQPQLSPDGRFRWDGYQWQPTAAAAPSRLDGSRSQAGLVLGLVGGISGLVAATLGLIMSPAMMAGWASDAEMAGMAWIFPVLATLGIAASIVGIVGGALAGSRPGLAAALMLGAGLGGLATVWFLYLVPGPLLLVGSYIAFRDSSRVPLAG